MPRLRKENWPVWYEGPTPIGCFNRKHETPFPADVLAERRARYEGAVAVCDDSGVVVIPPDVASDPAFIEKLNWIEQQEDLWFDCIDGKKWDTFETVCLKRYRENAE